VDERLAREKRGAVVKTIEQNRAGSLKWAKAHPEQKRATAKRYYTRNRERIRTRAKAYRVANADRVRLMWQKAHLKCSYGLTPDQVRAMFDRQGGMCAICYAWLGDKKDERKAHIDHDHATGKVRELLCGSCNRGLGGFYEEPEVMRRAADYIERHR
jgi:hypothetical protein